MANPGGANIQLTFVNKMRDDWRLKPKCKLKGHDDCRCLKPFVRIDLLREWMQHQDPVSAKTNGVLLFEEINPPEQKTIFRSGSSLLKDSTLVFSWLVNSGHGRLIHIFDRANFNDERLRDHKHPLDTDENLQKAYERDFKDAPVTFEDLTTALKSSRWEFCPVDLDARLEGENLGTERYIPFCEQRRIDYSGGTAAVCLVVIQKVFVSTEKQRYLGPPSDLRNYGPCYELAIKRISVNRWEIYSDERWAYKALHDKRGMLRCLSSYGSTDGNERNWHNILLEYADENLDEFLSKQDPPRFAIEVCSQWEDICKIAKAIETLHNFEYEGRQWSGWHGDIKPRNLLRVGKEWKLADYGFAVFHKKSQDASSVALLKECTQTCGAPETVRRDKPVLQTVDTWSFGCVLSIVATWVVLGSKGVHEYREHRFLASQTLSRETGPSDVFHDRLRVLPQIKEWHNLLKQAMRRSDNITEKVLDIIDKRLLLQDPKARLTFCELREQLDEIILTARNSLITAPRPEAIEVRPPSPARSVASEPITDSPSNESQSIEDQGPEVPESSSSISPEHDPSHADSPGQSSEVGHLPEDVPPRPDPPTSEPEVTEVDVAWEYARTGNSAALKERLTYQGFGLARLVDEEYGRTLIMIAARNNHLDAVDLLVEHSDMSVKDKEDKTVLHYLVTGQCRRPTTQKKFLDTLVSVLEHKPLSQADETPWIDWMDRGRQTCLLFCVRNDMPQAMQLLLKYGASVNGVAEANARDTPLVEAMRTANNRIVGVLLDRHASTQHRDDLRFYKDKVSSKVWNRIQAVMGDVPRRRPLFGMLKNRR